ncbi:hypothetical protein B0H14DRAFT_333220 [Mycena olivaceomarginata]|nr:hypothetical protein B0H14DRAFT_333220 [Mycena olivaceomarginata]
MPEPTNVSLVDALLPEDLIIAIVELAAQERTTAVSLALVSKAVGRMAEILLYKSIFLQSPTSVRAFTATLRTKSRPVLAKVAELTLTQPAPRDLNDFSDLWALVGQWCPHIVRLTLSTADTDAIQPTCLQPRHMTLHFIDWSDQYTIAFNQTDPSSGPWNHVTHLCLHDHPPNVLVPLLEADAFPRLTHFSCYMGMQHHHTNVVSYGAILRLLVLHTLQVCLVLGGYLEGSIFTNMFLQGMPHGDKRLVVFLADVTNELPDSDAPYWELAEKTIAARRGTAKQ